MPGARSFCVAGRWEADIPVGLESLWHGVQASRPPGCFFPGIESPKHAIRQSVGHTPRTFPRILHESGYLTVAFKELTCFVPSKCDPFSSQPPPPLLTYVLVAGCSAPRTNAELRKGWPYADLSHLPTETEKLSFEEHVGSSGVASSAQKFRFRHSRDESGWDAKNASQATVLKTIKMPTIKHKQLKKYISP